MPDPVLLLHGLGRTGLSMMPLARALRRAGFSPHVVDYPSRRRTVQALVEIVLAPRVNALLAGGAGREPAARVHFVTHSLGGVVVRAFAAGRYDRGRPLPEGSRAVMLAPPHGGSEVADALRARRPFPSVLGPALGQLGTDAASVPNALGDVRGIEAGVIAGTGTRLPFGRLFAGPHDGLVSVASAHAPGGLADAIVLPPSHSTIMWSSEVIRQTVQFLRAGRFDLA
ncbi:esterase/lipase family protein [Rubrivirga litoralis]|uniref:Alpha/beta fold hydrolase n=1 Tax=Rubrivirga litoralis TaxID=3075598 RepID=A0ABU3BMV4_9BACT|nr:alpha/beta fold hydrolase [Rubrivirga sp. F394]MDT0630627.1 alpha/beta fold hydrolase [Rubrivirga sp. F394]